MSESGRVLLGEADLSGEGMGESGVDGEGTANAQGLIGCSKLFHELGMSEKVGEEQSMLLSPLLDAIEKVELVEPDASALKLGAVQDGLGIRHLGVQVLVQLRRRLVEVSLVRGQGSEATILVQHRIHLDVQCMRRVEVNVPVHLIELEVDPRSHANQCALMPCNVVASTKLARLAAISLVPPIPLIVSLRLLFASRFELLHVFWLHVSLLRVCSLRCLLL